MIIFLFFGLKTKIYFSNSIFLATSRHRFWRCKKTRSRGQDLRDQDLLIRIQVGFGCYVRCNFYGLEISYIQFLICRGYKFD